MKKMKKIFAVILSLAMVLGMSLTAFAAGDPGADKKVGTNDDRGTITVRGITKETGVTVTAYQIVKANYGNSGESFSGYTAVYPNTVTIPKAGEAVSVDEEQLSNILDNYINAVPSQVVANTTYSMALSEDGVATADVPVGSYLVVISGAETKVYSPIVVSVYYVNENGSGNDFAEGNINTGQ